MKGKITTWDAKGEAMVILDCVFSVGAGRVCLYNPPRSRLKGKKVPPPPSISLQKKK
jgi:hypothetical protein